MKIWTGLIAAAALLSGSAGLAADAPQAVRQILQRQDVSGTDKESVIGTAELPAGAATSRHTHPGEEIGYVLKGPLLLKVDGQADRVLQAGESFAIPRGAVHQAMGVGGGEAKAVSVWIIDKGAELARTVN